MVSDSSFVSPDEFLKAYGSILESIGEESGKNSKPLVYEDPHTVALYKLIVNQGFLKPSNG